jgi:hypothetical protein
MRNIVKGYFIFLIACLISQNLNAQKFTSEERRMEAENILNTVINSLPFDSVYSQKRVYFLANELLSEDSQLVLKRKKCKAHIICKDKLGKSTPYVVLGDFTLNWDNPVAVRVQLQVMPDNKLLNIRLVKKNGKWILQNHVIFEG